jgi:hypothetical protein
MRSLLGRIPRPYQYILIVLAEFLVITTLWFSAGKEHWPEHIPVPTPRPAVFIPTSEAVHAAYAARCLGWSKQQVTVVVTNFSTVPVALDDAESGLLYEPVVIDAHGACTHERSGPLMSGGVEAALWVDDHLLVELARYPDGSFLFAARM